ncbi:MAG: hypothetical protein WDM92_07045 [Caulobacteraceae bacterium]
MADGHDIAAPPRAASADVEVGHLRLPAERLRVRADQGAGG